MEVHYGQKCHTLHECQCHGAEQGHLHHYILWSVSTLCDEVLFKLLQELKVEQIFRSQCLLTHHCLHGLDILTNGIVSILCTWGRERERGREKRERERSNLNLVEGLPSTLTNWFETSAWSLRVIP